MRAPPATKLDRRAALTGAAALAVPRRAVAQPAEAWSDYAARLSAGVTDPSLRLDADVARDLLAATNRLRTRAGATLLAAEPELDRLAGWQAADLLRRGYFDHVSPEGFAPSSRVALFARSLCGTSGENIAAGSHAPAPTGENLAAFWADSPGHRDNMLRAAHTHAGHGVARRGETFAAVAVFVHLDARFPAPMPFRLAAADLPALVARALPTLGHFSLEPATPDGGHAHAPDPIEGPPTPGLWRLRPFLRDGAQSWRVSFGPVFELV